MVLFGVAFCCDGLTFVWICLWLVVWGFALYVAAGRDCAIGFLVWRIGCGAAAVAIEFASFGVLCILICELRLIAF